VADVWGGPIPVLWIVLCAVDLLGFEAPGLRRFLAGVVPEYAVVAVPHVNGADSLAAHLLWQACFAQARVASGQRDNGAEVTHLASDVCANLMALHTRWGIGLALSVHFYTGWTGATFDWLNCIASEEGKPAAVWFPAAGASRLLLDEPASYSTRPRSKLVMEAIELQCLHLLALHA